MTAMAVAAPPPAPAARRRRKPWVVLTVIVVVAAVLGLYSLRPVADPGPSATGVFRTDYAVAVAEFRADTQRLQAEGQQVSGSSTEKIIPIYEQLRDLTSTAADRFEALDAPDAAQADYDTFIRLLRQQAVALDSVVKDATKGSARALAADLQRYALLVADWITARQKVDVAIGATTGTSTTT